MKLNIDWRFVSLAALAGGIAAFVWQLGGYPKRRSP